MTDEEAAIIERFKKIEGQLRGLQTMVADQRGCEAVLTQILSARTALDRAAAQVVTTYLDECLDSGSPEEARRQLHRAVQLLSRVG